jgi:hypothetical protein
MRVRKNVDFMPPAKVTFWLAVRKRLLNVHACVYTCRHFWQDLTERTV